MRLKILQVVDSQIDFIGFGFSKGTIEGNMIEQIIQY
jgi:hypothetical protein